MWRLQRPVNHISHSFFNERRTDRPNLCFIGREKKRRSKPISIDGQLANTADSSDENRTNSNRFCIQSSRQGTPKSMLSFGAGYRMTLDSIYGVNIGGLLCSMCICYEEIDMK